MEIKTKSELGMMTTESRDAKRAAAAQDQSVPGVENTERQSRNQAREAAALKPSQATDHFRAQGATIDVVA